LASYLDEWIKHDPSEVVPVYDEALDWLEKNQPDCPRTSLVWGDAKLGNVLYRPATCEVAAVIDWEIAMIGDPEVDLASLRVSDLRAQQSAGRCPGTPSEAELTSSTSRRAAIARLPLRPDVFGVLARAVTMKAWRRMKA
jgi:aminoglycoside phosphotransferase (APT) family kinase protein